MKNKTPSHWDPESTATFWINHASRLLMRHFEERLRPLDFGMAYLPVAIALEKNGALPQRRLAEIAHVEQPTMAALLARMERDGLISRDPHPGDKRSSLIALSDKAKERLPLAEGQLMDIVDQAMAGFDEEERRMLMALMRRVVSNLDPTLALDG